MPEEKYRLSFTTGGLFSQESAMVAEIYLRTQDWLLTREQVRNDNLLQVRTASAALRISLSLPLTEYSDRHLVSYGPCNYTASEAVEWLLLTTVPTLPLEDAPERLNWYAARWNIEV
jgi:hypothetical protein